MDRTLKYAAIGVGVSIAAFTIWNHLQALNPPPGTPTTVNPAATHYPTIVQTFTSTATAPGVLLIGAIGGLLVAKGVIG